MRKVLRKVQRKAKPRHPRKLPPSTVMRPETPGVDEACNPDGSRPRSERARRSKTSLSERRAFSQAVRPVRRGEARRRGGARQLPAECPIGREKGRAGGDAKGVGRQEEEARGVRGRWPRLDADARSSASCKDHPGRVIPAAAAIPRPAQHRRRPAACTPPAGAV